MKDQTDTQTVELFPESPKRRGRPVTGKAKSGALRQAEYRRRKCWGHGKAGNGSMNLNQWIESGAYYALQRLAAEKQVDIATMLEILIGHADEAKQKEYPYGSPEWDMYFDKTLHVTENKG